MGQGTLSLESLIPTLQLAIGPVILISGVGLLLLCMTNRIARVIDRARIVAADCHIVGNDELEVCYEKLEILSQRAEILRASIAMAAVSVLLVAVLVILLFCGALFRVEIAGLIVALFVGCMCSLIGSLALFIRDVNLSLQALWLDFPIGRRGKAFHGRRGSGSSTTAAHRSSTPVRCT
jgi:Protein of unknown function (DUF2721)